MKSYLVEVTCRVRVQIDPAKFTVEKMEDFNACITDFGTDEDAFDLHARHIASLTVIKSYDFEGHIFVEGYGYVDEAGVTSILENDGETEIISPLLGKGGAA